MDIEHYVRELSKSEEDTPPLTLWEQVQALWRVAGRRLKRLREVRGVMEAREGGWAAQHPSAST